MKKVINIGVAILCSSSLIATALGHFIDIKLNHPAFEAIEYLHEKGIISGYKDGTFQAGRKMNRAEFTKIVLLAAGHTSGPPEDCFLDVKTTDWFSPYVCAAKRLGIVQGYADGRFHVSDFIPISEAAAIIVRAHGMGVEPDPQLWFRPYINMLSRLGAIPPTILHVNMDVTRGEMVMIIHTLHLSMNASASSDSLASSPAPGSVAPSSSSPSASQSTSSQWSLSLPSTFFPPAESVSSISKTSSSRSSVRSSSSRSQSTRSSSVSSTHSPGIN